MRALIGLGNPGEKYEHTRHNVGFACLDAVAESLGEKGWKRMHDCEVVEANLDGMKYLLVKPQQFMNNSGRPLRALTEYYGLSAADLCIVADDVYIAPGTVRIRREGADGGHNGWKSIQAHLELLDYWRVRIGVGVYEQNPEKRLQQPALEDYVLQRMPPHDQKVTDALIDNLVPNLVEWLKHGTLSQETVHL